jgi:bacterioferritin B
MIIHDKVAAAINLQVGNELGAFSQYVAIGAYFDRLALPELKAYFYTQADEERGHAMKMIQFLCDADYDLTIPSIAQPVSRFDSVEKAVELSYNQEVRVTEQISAIYNLAVDEKDRVSESFLKWFLDEQLEEVASMDALLRIVRRAGEEFGLFRVEDYVARAGHPENRKKGGKED